MGKTQTTDFLAKDRIRLEAEEEDYKIEPMLFL